MPLTLTPLQGIPLVQSGDDLSAFILEAMERADLELESGDILVLAQKIVSKAEGRLVHLSEVTPSEKALALAEWEAACLEHAGTEPQEYDMATEWNPGKVVLHPNFGKGVVTKTLSERKIEVIFQDSRKRLVQNLKK